MRVLVFTSYFYPEKTGIGVTATDCARFIKSYGHDVTVVTAMPFYPEWRIHDEYRGKFLCTEELEGIVVKRHWLYVPERLSTLKRIIYELSFGSLAFVRLLFSRYDLLIIISPPLSAGVVAVVVNMLRRKKLWSYIKDIQPDAAITLGMLRNKFVIAVSRWMEKVLYQNSDKVLVLSEGMKRNIAAKDVASEKLEVVPDSIDIDELYCKSAHDRAISRFRKKYNLQDRFLVLYSGNLGVKHNVEIIVECAQRLAADKEIFFAIVGQGASRPRLEEMIAEHKLENVGLFPLAERVDLPDMLCSADVLLAPQRREVIDIVVPSKLLSYLGSGRPVIASAHPDSEAATILTTHDAGILIPPEEPDELAAKVQKVKSEPEWAAAIGSRGRELVRGMFHHDVVRDGPYGRLFGS